MKKVSAQLAKLPLDLARLVESVTKRGAKRDDRTGLWKSCRAEALHYRSREFCIDR